MSKREPNRPIDVVIETLELSAEERSTSKIFSDGRADAVLAGVSELIAASPSLRGSAPTLN